MLNHISYKDLGHADHGWLQARHHFSFARYYNPQRMGFGVLRVVNDDLIAPHQGFAPHPHDNMEIITYVRRGAISHKDSAGNEGKTKAGEVQVMSAGTGIIHSEYNREDEQTSLYQIWILPEKRDIQPHWDSHPFPGEPVKDKLTLLVSGEYEDAPLTINQQASIYGGRLEKGTRLDHSLNKLGYLLVSEGIVEVNGIRAEKGDAIEISKENEISIEAVEEAEVVLMDIPEQ